MTPTKKAAPRRPTKSAAPPPLRESAAAAIDHFLATLDGESCRDLYDMVLHQVEAPLLKAVLDYTQQNQSHAAAMLGLNRGTLRKKLRQHGLLTEAEAPKKKKRTRIAKTPTKKTPDNKKTPDKRKR